MHTVCAWKPVFNYKKKAIGKMKILVLGGTGAMGKHLVHLLDSDGVETIVTSRKKRKSEGFIHYVQGNARDMCFLETLLQSTFDCIVDFMIYTTQEFSHRYKKLLSNTKQYIFLSSARVYASSPSPLTEASPRLLDVSTDETFLATDEYALAKARQEDILRNSGFTNYTILRPYITYSEIRLQLGVLEKETWLQRALRGKTVLFSREMAEHKTTVTYGLNVAQSILSVIGKEKAYGQVFHITQNQSLSWRNIWEIYKPVIENYTQTEAKIQFVNMPIFSKIFQSSYAITYDRLFDRTFDNTKINEFIDTSLFIKPEEGLHCCLCEFIAKGQPFLHSSMGLEGKMDYYTKEYLSLSQVYGVENKLRYLIRRLGI